MAFLSSDLNRGENTGFAVDLGEDLSSLISALDCGTNAGMVVVRSDMANRGTNTPFPFLSSELWRRRKGARVLRSDMVNRGTNLPFLTGRRKDTVVALAIGLRDFDMAYLSSSFNFQTRPRVVWLGISGLDRGLNMPFWNFDLGRRGNAGAVVLVRSGWDRRGGGGGGGGTIACLSSELYRQKRAAVVVGVG